MIIDTKKLKSGFYGIGQDGVLYEVTLPKVWTEQEMTITIDPIKLESTGVYDQEEIHPNCTVQILKNSVTGEETFGWYDNDNPPAIID